MTRPSWRAAAVAFSLLAVPAAARGTTPAASGGAPVDDADYVCTVGIGAEGGASTVSLACGAAAAAVLEGIRTRAPSAHLCAVDASTSTLRCFYPGSTPVPGAGPDCFEADGRVECRVPYVSAPPTTTPTCASLAQAAGLPASAFPINIGSCSNLSPGSCLCVPPPSPPTTPGYSSRIVASGDSCNAIATPAPFGPAFTYTPPAAGTGTRSDDAAVDACVSGTACGSATLPTVGGSVPAIGMLAGAAATGLFLRPAVAPSCRDLQDGKVLKSDVQKTDAPDDTGGRTVPR